MSPDEARKDYLGKGSVLGGHTPYLQQQYFSLAALAERDSEKPFAKAASAAPRVDVEDDNVLPMAAMYAAIRRKAITEGLHAA